MRRSRAPEIAGLALAALCAAAPVQAQTVGFGVRIGANLSEVNVSGNESLNVAFRSRFEPAGGAFVTFRLTSTLFLEADALLSIKGSDFDAGGVHSVIRLRYVEAPVLLRLAGPDGARVRVHIFGGGYAAWLLSTSRSGSGDGSPVWLDELRDYDFGWIGGVGMGAGWFELEARYSGGITNLAPRAASTGLAFRNRSFVFLAGFRFR